MEDDPFLLCPGWSPANSRPGNCSCQTSRKVRCVPSGETAPKTKTAFLQILCQTFNKLSGQEKRLAEVESCRDCSGTCAWGVEQHFFQIFLYKDFSRGKKVKMVSKFLGKHLVRNVVFFFFCGGKSWSIHNCQGGGKAGTFATPMRSRKRISAEIDRRRS